MKPLLRSALWYLRYWKMNPLFNNIWKAPIHDSWTPFYMKEVAPEDVVREYNKIVKNGKKPAGVALVPSPKSRTVIIDLDIYRVEYGLDAREIATRLADKYIVAITPRGGLRIVFQVPEGDYLPHRFTISWFGEKIGEGGGTYKHPWTVPPSIACVKHEELPEGGKKCIELKQYYFVLPSGKLAKYPWELPWKEPPVIRWEDAKTHIETDLQIKIILAETVESPGELKIGSLQGVPFIPAPCWRNLDEFIEWLEDEAYPPLPPCVAYALGYRVEGGEMIYTGQKVPHGLRYTMGAIATIFLAACIAEFDPKELIDYIGQNLEDYPQDEGEPLNTKLSRLLVRIGNIIIPKYMGLGSIANNIPPELCRKCIYRSICTRGFETEENEELKDTVRRIPYIQYIIEYYQLNNPYIKQ